MVETIATFFLLLAFVWVFDWVAIWENQSPLQDRANRKGRAKVRAAKAYRWARAGLFLTPFIGAAAVNARSNQTAMIFACVAAGILIFAYSATLFFVIIRRNL